MKIRAPDDSETSSGNTSKQDTKAEITSKFIQEIEGILEMPEMPSEYVVESLEYSTVQYELEVLRKFTALCRQMVLPRHHKAGETIQTKTDELHCTHLVQQKNLVQLFASVKELEESREQLKEKIKQTQATQQNLSERLKEVLNTLKNYCKSRTMAEAKMAQDLVDLDKKTKDLKVKITDTAAKVNYYAKQTNSQSEEVTKYSKPLYLDKNRAVFMRSNLNSMRQNIEQLVSRVKTLKNQMEEIEGPDCQED